MVARIYKPARNAMQSGLANTKHWVLEFEPQSPRRPDPLMGWISSDETRTQVKLWFDTKEQAIAYAKRNGLAYRVLEPKPRRITPKSYADNFRYGRVGCWTH